MKPKVDVAHKDNCVQRSILKGLKSGSIALAVSGAIVYALNHYSLGFRTGLSISGKTALVTTPMMFMFFLDSHLEMGACSEEQERLTRERSD